MSKRKIIKIDEEKCNGCGQCIPNCKEGALKIVGGKARLVSEVFCDGLGACLGHCPQGAITIEEREAADFDEKKVEEHLKKEKKAEKLPCGCPGTNVVDLRSAKTLPARREAGDAPLSQLRQWPVQIRLVPPHAPYLSGADLLVAADCVPFAYADFHDDLLRGRVLLVGCPKLDDLSAYGEKIGAIARENDIRSITYARMEVPCCAGLSGVIKEAIESSGKKIPYKEVVISISGEKLK